MELLNIRSRISNSRLGRLINNSKAGKWFEKTDFAMATELTIRNQQWDWEYGSGNPLYDSAGVARKVFSAIMLPFIAPLDLAWEYTKSKIRSHLETEFERNKRFEQITKADFNYLGS